MSDLSDNDKSEPTSDQCMEANAIKLQKVQAIQDGVIINKKVGIKSYDFYQKEILNLQYILNDKTKCESIEELQEFLNEVEEKFHEAIANRKNLMKKLSTVREELLYAKFELRHLGVVWDGIKPVNILKLARDQYPKSM
ncbi:hypothetical protein KGF54_005512 [Candida jiufengensis]|uniref:uncharacterized protein n=1 Tax=Candida jiufengensis TaxID=497108 RepID=UPI002224D6BB|nr:uncharacterized protein KGF54_005512 [Candida jiufengensis]KAI5949277.1 hypothetical protein KGF54_005512 [Candida jiufengensis]